MADIFISYRREDDGGHAGRLCDRLSGQLGDDRVFMDVQDIRPGQNFVHSIDETIARCDCVLAIIGPRWVDALNRRAHGEDFVRHEVAAALTRGIAVIPVLVGGARMPDARRLPPDLVDLSQRQAVEIRDERFDDDVKRLIEAVAARDTGATTGARRPSHRLRTAALLVAVVVLAAAAALAFYMRRPVAAPIDVSGVWVAEMQKPGQRPYRIRLTLSAAGEQLIGAVDYPTGTGQIADGKLTGRTATFSTTHVPQFASEPATIRFQATIDPDAIHLTSADDNGVATGTARRQP